MKEEDGEGGRKREIHFLTPTTHVVTFSRLTNIGEMKNEDYTVQ